jgi:hypothetical protein
MQILLGIILGVFLTIGVAYVHDGSLNSNPPASGTSVAIERPMVNWDVVNGNWRDLKERMNAGWRKLQSIG